MITDRKDQWSVWWAYVKHDDGGGKERPVIVAMDYMHACSCFLITSKKHARRYKIKDLTSAGLPKESWVSFERIDLTPNNFLYRMGTICESDIVGLQTWLRSSSFNSY